MSDLLDEQSIKTLDTVNDFPHVGLIYFENSGENLLRFYLEQIFRIQTQTNIRKEFLINSINNIFPKKDQDLNLFWVIPSDYPLRDSNEYDPIDISIAVVLVRNPIEVIMSYLLKESLLLEEALRRADEMINQWKEFYKYWINAPIPCYIVKYEELIDDPCNILKDLSRFMLGIKSIEETKLDYSIQKAVKIDVDSKYLAFDVSMKQSDNLSDNILTQFQEKFTKLNSLMKKFKYAEDEYDNNDMSELLEEESAANWINEFNNENLIKSVELQENIANSVLTSSYYSLRLN
jgi:hypothetical protein